MSGKLGQKGRKPTDVAKRFRRDFLELMDGRVAAVKTLHERLRALVSDLGGLEALSYQEKSLARRVVHLEHFIAQKEAALVQGSLVDIDEYLSCVNALSGLFGKLGMKRRAKSITLTEFLKNKSESPSPTTEASHEHD